MKYLLISIFFYAGTAFGQLTFTDSMIKKSALEETVFFLSQDSLKGRLTGSAGAYTAARFIAAKFDSLGFRSLTGEHVFIDSFVADFEGRKFQGENVAAALPGRSTDDTMIIFSAHYDHIGERDDLPYNKEYSSTDYIFNGANDNATGVAALLEIAKYYKARNDNRYLVLFVAFSGEEMGMLGSAHFMKKTKRPFIKAVINLEMLGRPVDARCFVVSFNNSAIRNMLNRNLQKFQNVGEKKFFENDPYPDEELSRRSDHYPFTKKIKNAFTIMGSSPADTYYHSVDDEYQTIDFDFLLKATINIALACEQFTR